MGCKSSKVLEDNIPVVDGTAGGSEIIIESEDMYDREVISYIKNELKNRPESFLLNNLLMSMVFFKNYEKDLYDFSNTAISKEEQKLNAKLVTEVKKCILPENLFEKIQENIKFCDDNHEEQMSLKTIYVVNDNIEVKDRNDQTIYTSIEVPGCQVEIEDIDEEADITLLAQGAKQRAARRKELERKGFLKLRVLESSLSKMKSNQISQRNVLKRSQPVTSNPTTPEMEEYEEYSDEYSSITDFKTPKSLNIVKTTQRRDTLPESCFQVKKMRKLKDNDSEEEEEEEAGSEEETDDFDETASERQKRISDLYEDVTYLSSKGFMEYFQNEVFPNTTGKILGFSDKEIESAQAMPGCIFCDKNQMGQDVSCRIVPAVAIDWPVQATEYIYRKTRTTIIDKRDAVVYKWPTNEMVRELKTLNCVVIPKGFAMKKGQNENTDIEWEICFPKAARYLEMRMSHPQVRCYIFLLAIYKTFIEKFTTYHGVLVDNIRTHMFWECEADAKNWPEHKMGNKILKVIEDLNSGLSRSKIPHYFIKGRNIFENIPSKYLQFSQKILHDVLQFPTMHFLKALKNIKYVHSDYYPTPDLDHLYRLLTNEPLKVPTRLKNKRRETKVKPRTTVVQVGSQRRRQRQKIEDLKWKKKNEQNNRNKFLQKQKEREEEEAAKAAKLASEEKSIKSAFTNLNVITQISVLKFFIRHFIDVAQKSRKIGPTNQTLFYLKQAWYLMKVLEELEGVYSDTVETAALINRERELLERENQERREGIAPPTPVRNSEQDPLTFTYGECSAGLKKKFSFTANRQSEAALKNREKRLMRERRPKSVGFDDNVEKISFTPVVQ